MVHVNFRLESNWTEEKIFQIFQELGYIKKGFKKKEIQIEYKFIPTHEFVREKKNGRNHIFLFFGNKASGTEAYPQLKVYTHYDIYRKRKGKVVHIPSKNEERDVEEMYRIHRALKKAGLGYLEHKYMNCWHVTLEKIHKKKIKKYIKENGYIKFEPGKYRKSMETSQYVIVLEYERKYIHIICVYAFITEINKHILNREKAKKEMNKVMTFIKV